MSKAISALGAGTFSVQEVFLMLFRNKWKILILTSLGLAGGAAVYVKTEPPYQSSAKFYLRYVVESQAGAVGPDSRVRSIDNRGENLLNAEVEILGSGDLARDVAVSIGPDKLVVNPATTNLAGAATRQIMNNLKIHVPVRSSVITLTYSHPHPDITVKVLEEVLRLYRERHIAAHSSAGAYEQLVKDADTLSARIRETQGALSKLKESLGVTSLSETKLQLSQQISGLENSIIMIRADMAQDSAVLSSAQSAQSGQVVGTVTNLTVAVVAPVPDEVAARYRLLQERLVHFRSQELQLIGQFTEQNPLVKQAQARIADTEKDMRSLEVISPGLLAPAASSPSTAATGGSAAADLGVGARNLIGSGARLKVLEEQLASFRRRLSEIISRENEIREMERRLAVDEQTHSDSQMALQQARRDEVLDPSKIPNIYIVQNPTMPVQNPSKRTQTALGLVVLGIGLGLGWTLAREFVFDNTVRNPIEIESKLQLPMFLAIPAVSDRHPVRLIADASEISDEVKNGVTGVTRLERAPWEVSHFIRPFCEALRDRLIMYFQLKNIHHKPKLIAITSCHEGAGTTTVAAGLAASLSETADGKVLLVDMNVGRPEMHPFFRGNLAGPLKELLDHETRPGHGEHENLYLATATERNGSVGTLVPAKFYQLLPRLRSSDFDYIIFDMPPIKQTSATVALSGFMDKVLLMVEPGRTHRDSVKRACDLLREQHADVAGVVNKLPGHTPRWLQPELG